METYSTYTHRRLTFRIHRVLLISFSIALGCGNHADQSSSNNDTLRQAAGYAPGFGEFMTSVQIHHAKLWFAGQAQNWELADFEVHEIIESLDNIKKFNTDRPESKSIDMIQPSVDSVSQAISTKNQKQFEVSFLNLTNTCNGCHRATGHAFNVVKVPDTPPFSNQDFKVTK